MSYEDFDVERLAIHLHLRPDQIQRMAERGKLPGRRIAGQWRFSQAEMHHWWEARIGDSDTAGLAQMETVLQRYGTEELPTISLTTMLFPEAIAIPLEARTRNSVITGMVRLAAGTGLLWDEAKMSEAVKAREDLHPTALDCGVALLHPRRPLSSILAEPLLAFGATANGIPFGGGGSLTDLFFLICSCDERGHLRVLARLSRLVGNPLLLSALRVASTAAEVRALIQEYEQQLPD